MTNDQLIQKILCDLEQTLHHDALRLRHVYAVRDMALKLANHYGCEPIKTELAALLHDITKTKSNEENRLLASTMIDEDVPEACYHAFAASTLARQRYFIQDQEILDAIKYHCSGRKNMRLLEKIIFVSDFIEINRDFVTDALREKALENLDLTVYIIMKQTVKHLENQNEPIAKLTREAIIDYQKRFGGIE